MVNQPTVIQKVEALHHIRMVVVYMEMVVVIMLDIIETLLITKLKKFIIQVQIQKTLNFIVSLHMGQMMARLI